MSEFSDRPDDIRFGAQPAESADNDYVHADGITAEDPDDDRPGDIDESVVLPMDCINVDGNTLGQRCDDCPLPEDDCKPLAAGQLLLAQEATITELGLQNERLTTANRRLAETTREQERENAYVLERLFNLRLDSLVETAFTPEGLRDHLMHDEEIREELGRLTWGVIRLDGRFVNYINRFGNEVGDDFLQRGGQLITAITDGLVRVNQRRSQIQEHEPERRESQRRAGHSLGQEDIICRQGGDEFALLIRKVTPQQLAIITARVQSKLTVPYALERYASGQIPFIASVGSAHATDRRPEAQMALRIGDPWHAFRLINGLADEGQRVVKSQQYKEMWEMIQRSMPASDVEASIAQPDDRIVAEQFLTRLCPDFRDDPIMFLLANQ